MKTNANFGSLLKGGERRDKRVRHGMDTKAVKQYRKLDREFRNTEQPDADMIKKLGTSILNALDTVSTATDTNNPDSRDRLVEFAAVECMNALGGIKEEVFRKLRADNVED